MSFSHTFDEVLNHFILLAKWDEFRQKLRIYQKQDQMTVIFSLQWTLTIRQVSILHLDLRLNGYYWKALFSSSSNLEKIYQRFKHLSHGRKNWILKKIKKWKWSYYSNSYQNIEQTKQTGNRTESLWATILIGNRLWLYKLSWKEIQWANEWSKLDFS